MGIAQKKTLGTDVLGSINPTLDTFINARDSYDLYNADIEAFFQKNFVYHDVLHRKDHFASLKSFGRGSIVYLHRGRLKNYVTNPAGQEVFLGFIPQYSTLSTMKSGYELGKSMVANTDCSIYVTTNDAYLEFLQSSPELIQHQLLEPYYRRNLNDFPKIETMFYPAQVKVYEYILFLVTLFGKENASRYLSELEEADLVSHSSKFLTVHDVIALSNEIESLKQAYLEK